MRQARRRPAREAYWQRTGLADLPDETELDLPAGALEEALGADGLPE